MVEPTDPPHARGRRAEEAVARYLERAGAEVLGTNVRVGRLELDVVARDGRVVLVVEVRTRGDGAWTTAFGSIDRGKRFRIRRAAERLWRRRFRRDPTVDRLRIDAASVSFATSEPVVEYVKAAF